jgi:hypothetical protein
MQQGAPAVNQQSPGGTPDAKLRQQQKEMAQWTCAEVKAFVAQTRSGGHWHEYAEACFEENVDGGVLVSIGDDFKIAINLGFDEADAVMLSKAIRTKKVELLNHKKYREANRCPGPTHPPEDSTSRAMQTLKEEEKACIIETIEDNNLKNIRNLVLNLGRDRVLNSIRVDVEDGITNGGTILHWCIWSRHWKLFRYTQTLFATFFALVL